MPPASEEIIRALPCWRGPLTIEILHGGLSNANFKVTDAHGGYVARLGRDFPFHHVSRRREAAASRAAEAAGLAPRVHYFGHGVLVSEFVEGRTFTTQDLCENTEAIVALIVRGHCEMRARIRGEAAMFWVFHVIRDYCETLLVGAHAMAPELADLANLATELESAQFPLPVVFGHHDLLPGNFLADGRRLWLIDWEYAGFGTPMFDLANLADNGGFDPALEIRLLSLYFDRAPDEATLRAFAAMKLASALREWLWALVSELHMSAPGVDYAAYATSCRAKFERARRLYRETHGLPQ